MKVRLILTSWGASPPQISLDVVERVESRNMCKVVERASVPANLNATIDIDCGCFICDVSCTHVNQVERWEVRDKR